MQVLTQTEDGMHKKKFTVTLFADIAGAFDTVTGEAIINSMVEKEVDKIIIGWYQQYISNRIATL